MGVWLRKDELSISMTVSKCSRPSLIRKTRFASLDEVRVLELGSPDRAPHPLISYNHKDPVCETKIAAKREVQPLLTRPLTHKAPDRVHSYEKISLIPPLKSSNLK